MALGADVPRVAEAVDRREVPCEVGDAVEPCRQLFAPQALDGALVKAQPVGRGVHVRLGDADLPPAHVFVGVQLHLLEDGGEEGDRHFAHFVSAVGVAVLFEAVQHLQLHRELGVRVVVHGDGRDVRLFVVPIEVLHLVLLAAVDVDRVLVDEQRRARPVAFADHLRHRALLDDYEVVRARRAQADLLGGEGLAHPVVAVA